MGSARSSHGFSDASRVGAAAKKPTQFYSTMILRFGVNKFLYYSPKAFIDSKNYYLKTIYMNGIY